MLKLSEKTVTDRSELVCPYCLTEGLVEDPTVKQKNGKKDALLNATKCPTKNCE